MAESAFRRAALTWFTTTYGLDARLRGYPKAATGAPRGEPDLFGSIYGRAVVIELKEGKNTPSPIQKTVMALWVRAGAIGIVAWSLEGIKNDLRLAGLYPPKNGATLGGQTS